MLRRLPVPLLLALALALPARAQDARPAGFAGDFLVSWNDTADKTAAIAATGEEAYAWRPAEGVRSTNEVLLHVAAANYLFTRMLGVQPPEGFSPQGYETSTSDPAEVAAAVEASFAHAREALLALDPEALDDEVEWFGGGTNTKRGVLIFMEKHASEHLGQLIAYLRTNGITPPWSE